MTELSPRARLMLDRYRASDLLTPQQKHNLLDELIARGARGDTPRFEVDVAPPDHPELGTLGRGARLLSTATSRAAAAALALSGLAAAAVLGTRELRSTAPSREPPLAFSLPRTNEPPVVDSPILSPPPVTSSALPSVAELARVAPHVAAGRHSRARATTSRTPDVHAPPAVDGTIDAEVRLMNAAQSELRAGKPDRALVLLDEHAARFPEGKLSDVRVVTRVIALCDTGNRRAALDQAKAFLLAYPTSPFAERVKSVCSHDGARDGIDH